MTKKTLKILGFKVVVRDKTKEELDAEFDPICSLKIVGVEIGRHSFGEDWFDEMVALEDGEDLSLWLADIEASGELEDYDPTRREWW